MSRLRGKILLFILCIFATSCATQQRCAEKFPLKDTVVYRDTVIYVTVTADTIKETAYITDTVYAATGTAGGSAWVFNDTIYLNVWQKDTIIEYRDSIKTVYSQQIVNVPCKKTPVLNRIIVIGIILLGLILVLKFR